MQEPMGRRPTTQDISWFLDLKRYGQLQLDPPYQRRSVWSPRDRRFFLDTIFRGYPSPAIFLHKSRTDNGDQVYEVVDGKQRLETIFGFVDNRFALDRDMGDERLNGKRWRQLDKHDDLKRRFWDYVLPVEFISIFDGNIVNEVFDRLNRNVRKLEPQELRHARYDGWLVTQAERESSDSLWKDVGFSTTARVKRMKDVQFISELLIAIIENAVQGFDQGTIDAFYAKYDALDDVDDFDAETFTDRVDAAKQYLRGLDTHNQCVQRHARPFVHMYSLWTAIALNQDRLRPPSEAADAYSVLMDRVGELAVQSDDLQAFIESAGDGDYDLAYKYLSNARGATTELPQRQARHDVLTQLLCIDSPEVA